MEMPGWKSLVGSDPDWGAFESLGLSALDT